MFFSLHNSDEILNFSPTQYIVSCKFLINGLYCIDACAYFLRIFILRWCWSLLDAFNASMEMVLWFLPLTLLVICIVVFMYVCWTILASLDESHLNLDDQQFSCTLEFAVLDILLKFLFLFFACVYQGLHLSFF